MRVVRRKNSHYAERLSTYVECQYLDVDGNPRLNPDGEILTREISAREIVSDWEEYWNEELVQKEKRDAALKERERKEQALKDENELILTRMRLHGIQSDQVRVGYGQSGVSIPRDEVKRWLKIA